MLSGPRGSLRNALPGMLSSRCLCVSGRAPCLVRGPAAMQSDRLACQSMASSLPNCHHHSMMFAREEPSRSRARKGISSLNKGIMFCGNCGYLREGRGRQAGQAYPRFVVYFRSMMMITHLCLIYGNQNIPMILSPNFGYFLPSARLLMSRRCSKATLVP